MPEVIATLSFILFTFYPIAAIVEFIFYNHYKGITNLKYPDANIELFQEWKSAKQTLHLRSLLFFITLTCINIILLFVVNVGVIIGLFSLFVLKSFISVPYKEAKELTAKLNQN